MYVMCMGVLLACVSVYRVREDASRGLRGSQDALDLELQVGAGM